MAKDSSAEGVSRRRSRPSRHAPWDLARHIDRAERRGRERRDHDAVSGRRSSATEADEFARDLRGGGWVKPARPAE
ncbi:MAG TPA: hypothetical protein VEX11_18560 [Acetobacteraceae bacterium]|nr:hypothetical protein [Acetobacteraceae bacterium]